MSIAIYFYQSGFSFSGFWEAFKQKKKERERERWLMGWEIVVE